MNVHELTRDQLVELKQAMLTSHYSDENSDPSYEELAYADKLIPDNVIYAEYAGYEFVPEDFSVTNPETKTIGVTNIDWKVSDDDSVKRFGSLTDDDGLPYTYKDFGLPSSIVLQMSKSYYDDAIECGEDEDEFVWNYIANRLANRYDFSVKDFDWNFIRIPNQQPKDEPMTVTEYLDTPNGKELKQLFDNYFTDAKKRGGEWWRCNCAHFAFISEAWSAFCEGHFNAVDEIDDGFADADPNNIFDGIIGWANGSGDAAIVLTCNHDDARNKELRDAWRWYKDCA